MQNKLYGEPDVTKLYYMGPMFRYERPQAGRYRQFHQFGVEVFGTADPAIDAEVIALGYSFYKELGLNGVKAEINSVGTPEVRAAYRSAALAFLEPMKENLCSDCQSRMERNPRACWTARRTKGSSMGRLRFWTAWMRNAARTLRK